MGLLFKFGQAVPETFAIQFSEKGGFCGQELKGNFILGVAPKTEFLMAFFCSPLVINPHNFVKNHPIFKNKELFMQNFVKIYTIYFSCYKKLALGSGV